MTNTTATLLDQLGGASRISAMTGAQIVVDKAYALLVFKKHVLSYIVNHYLSGAEALEALQSAKDEFLDGD